MKFGPDAQCYRVWARWYRGGLFYDRHLQAAKYWYCTKNPPHEGRYQYKRLSPSGLKMASLPSFHLNAQSFVSDTRESLKHSMTDGEDRGGLRIITHGWGERNAGAYWGWARLVRLQYDQQVFGRMACFYFRPNRVQTAYAYPALGAERWWYAGSSIIKQKLGKLHELHVWPKYDRWKRMFEDLARGEVMVGEEGEVLTGWRPIAADDEWVVRRGDVISLRPLWNSGIRHFPEQWRQVCQLIGINDDTLSRL